MKRVFNSNLPVTGDLFFGRKEQVDHLLMDLFEPAMEGETYYLALTGMNRIGKTSLYREAWRCFNETEHPNVIVIETQVSNYHSFWDFWIQGVLMPLKSELVTKTKLSAWEREEIDKLLDEYLNTSKKTALLAGDPVADSDGRTNLINLFRLLRDPFGIHIVLIMDEFDTARKVFGANREYFSWLRGLLQSGGGLSLLTVSRRSLEYIQLNSDGGSTLEGVISNFGLFGFTNSELDQYFDILATNGVVLSAEDKAQIYHYCGRSPYYLALMGEALLKGKVSAHIPSVSTQFYPSYKAVIKMLKDEQMLTAMLQMFVGPRYRLRSSDVDKLERLGYCIKHNPNVSGSDYLDYIQPKKTGTYLTVCRHFVEYLEEQAQDEVNNVWPKLTTTEQLLRKILQKEYMRMADQQGGADWRSLIWDDLTKPSLNGNSIASIDKLSRFNRPFQTLYSKADSLQRDKIGNSALNLISLAELGELVYLRWDNCSHYLSSSGYNRKNIRDAFVILKKARDPYAHSNADLLTLDEIEQVNTICDKLVRSIEKEEDRMARQT